MNKEFAVENDAVRLFCRRCGKGEPRSFAYMTAGALLLG